MTHTNHEGSMPLLVFPDDGISDHELRWEFAL
jgi:hypothetical protein